MLLESKYVFILDGVDPFQILLQVHYLPSLFIDPARYREMPCLDGVFHVGVAFL